MAIIKKFIKLGKSSALVIDRSILELLNMSIDMPVKIILNEDAKSITIRSLTSEENHLVQFKAKLKAESKRFRGGLKD